MEGAHFAQTRGAHFLTHLDEQGDVVAQLALSRGQNLFERGEVDGVLTLIVSRATAIPAVAANAQGPRR